MFNFSSHFKLWYLLLEVVSLTKVIDLSTSRWILSNDREQTIDNRIIENIVGRSLQRICTDDLQIIGDPMKDFNDIDQRWIIENTSWTIRTIFNITNPPERFLSTWLIIDQVQTIARFYVNGKIIGKSDSAFIPIYFKIPLKLGQNELAITFRSPVSYAMKKSWKYKSIFGYDVPPDKPYIYGLSHVNFLRQPQFSFGWDWAPSLSPIGLTGTRAEILMLNEPLYETNVNVFRKSKIWYVYVTFKNIQVHVDMTIRISIQDLNWQTKILLKKGVALEKQSFTLALDTEPELWYPRNHGMQKLYRLFTQVIYPPGLHMSTNHTIGFRYIKLVDEHDPAMFYLEVNGVGLFLKGVNWVPPDASQPRINNEYLRRLLISVIEAGLNFIRVWGGGLYESDKFYELTDRYGILVWQEAAFACASYPSKDKKFLRNVKKEIKEQFGRIGGHCSLVMISANNEIELAVAEKWYGTIDLKEDYKQLFKKIINQLARVIKGIPVMGSSPSNGKESLNSTFLIANNPNRLDRGDTHFYDYIFVDNWRYDYAPRALLLSEFGVQSIPFDWSSASSVDPVTTTDHPLFVHRQRHPNGYSILSKDLSKRFNLYGSNHSLTKVAYLTQLSQSQVIGNVFEEYLINGNGGCLYWMLVDTWVGPSWSTIEHGCHRWKMAHYRLRSILKRSLESSLVIKYQDKILELYWFGSVMNGTSIRCDLYSVRKFETEDIGLKVPISRIGLLSRTVLNIRPGLIIGCNLITTISGTKTPKYAMTTNKPIEYFKEQSIGSSKSVRITNVYHKDARTIIVSLSTSRPVIFVWLTTSESGWFDQNGFHWLHEPRTMDILFHKWSSDWRHADFDVMSLEDVLFDQYY